MFCKNCYIIQSSKQSLKINHYSLSQEMRETGGAKSLSCFPKGLTQKELVAKLCSMGWREGEGPAPTQYWAWMSPLPLHCLCVSHLFPLSQHFPCYCQWSHSSVCNYACVQMHIHRHARMSLICFSVYLVAFSRVLGRQNHGPTKMTTSQCPEPVNMWCYMAKDEVRSQMELTLPISWL